jgi:carbon monoxide dehydrogenase subunit G
MSWRVDVRAWVAALVAAALSLSGSAGLAGPVPAATPSAVEVSRDPGGVFHVRATFTVAAAPSVAWGVLTDYDHLAAFVPSMRRSLSTRTTDGRLTVEQEASGRIGPFTRTMHVVLDVTEEPRSRISFRDVSGRSFYTYAGSWSLAPAGDALLVTYTLAASPHRNPPLFAKSVVGSNARTFLDQLRREMVRREQAARTAQGFAGAGWQSSGVTYKAAVQ